MKRATSDPSRPPFLSRDDFLDFAEMYVRFPRRIVNELASQQNPQRLTEAAASIARDIVRTTTIGFNGMIVQVEPDDGMSYSASAVSEAVSASGLPVLHLAGPIPLDAQAGVLALLPPRRVRTCARRSGLLKAPFRKRSWIVVGGLIFLGGVLLAAFLQQLVLNEGAGILLHDWRAFALALVIAVAGGVGLWLQIPLSAESDNNASLIQRIAEAQRIALRNPAASEATAYNHFINRTARAIARLPYPRALIIDRHGALDPLSRSVLDVYISDYASERKAELWCSFERTDEPAASRMHALHRKDYGHRRTTIFRQIPLAAHERERLATHVGDPRRAKFHRVKYICDSVDDRVRYLERRFREYHLSHPPRENRLRSLDLLFLLAATSLGRDSPPFKLRRLPSLLVRHRGLRSELLAGLLPGGIPSLRQMDDALKVMVDEFSDCVVLNGPDQIQIAPEVGAVLVNNLDSLGLSDPETVQLFWCVFWFDHIGRARQPYFLRLLNDSISRLSRSRIGSLPEPIRAKFSEAALFSLKESLALGLFDDAPTLLRAAATSCTDSQRSRVLARAWQTYAILGEASVLEVILAMLGPAGADAKDPPSVDALVDLFMANAGIDISAPDGATLGRTVESIGGTLVDNARARAAWIAVTIASARSAPLLDRRLRSAVEATQSDLGPCVLRALSRVEGSWRGGNGARQSSAPHDPERLIVLDLFTASLGLSTMALLCLRQLVPAADNALFRERLLDCLLTSWVLLEDMLPASRSTSLLSGGVELPFEAMLQELVVVGAIAASILSSHPATTHSDLEEQLEERYSRMVEQLFYTGGGAATRDRRVELLRSLDLMHITWMRLGFTNFAQSLALRGAGAAIACGLPAETWPAMGIRAIREEGATLAVLEQYLQAAGETSKGQEQLSAMYFLAGSRQALDEPIASWLMAALALEALVATSLLAVPKTSLLELLVEGDQVPGSAPLAVMLHETSDDALLSLVLPVLNAFGGGTDRVDIADLVLRMLDERINSITDDHSRAVMVVERRNFELRAARSRPLDVDAEVKEWPLDRDGWQFAYRLLLVAHKGGVSERLVDEARRLLGDVQGSGSHALFLLAIDVGSHLESREQTDDLKLVADYLRSHIRHWRHVAQLEDAVRGYELLSRIDGIGSHSQGLSEVQASLERQRDQRRQLGSDHSGPFEVFLHDCKTLLYWGLAINGVPEVVLRELSSNLGQASAVERWRRGGAAVPDPFITDRSSNRLVNSEFLVIGCALFSPPVRLDSDYDENRAAFDRAARSALEWLLVTLVDLPELPRPVRAMLEAQLEQYRQITVGED